MRISLDERLKIAKLHIYEYVPIAQLAKDLMRILVESNTMFHFIKDEVKKLLRKINNVLRIQKN